MAKTSTVNIHVLPEIKEEAERVFNYHGLTLSEAINVFIKHSCYVGGFPFEPEPAPYTDPESIEALIEAELLKKDKNAKSFKTIEALIADLESDDDN